MKNAHIRDAVALCEFLALLSSDLEQQGNGSQGLQAHAKWSELSAAAELSALRRGVPNNKGDSFETISAVGPNAAKAHYVATNLTSQALNRKQVYLIDSGGQYLDGTTDVTRTVHFGLQDQQSSPSPSSPVAKDLEREAYTRVLMGAIDLTSFTFASGTKDIHISDLIARKHLMAIGLNYKHGTGHGIGVFLNVHDDTLGIGTSTSMEKGTVLQEGMFLSIEPGYYEDGNFGVRLENVVVVKKAKTPHRFSNKDYLTFEPVTLVPFEPKLIKKELLTRHHRRWLNHYNHMIRENIGKRLQLQNRKRAYDWLMSKTKHIDEDDCPKVLEVSLSSGLSLLRGSSLFATSCLFLLTAFLLLSNTSSFRCSYYHY